MWTWQHETVTMTGDALLPHFYIMQEFLHNAGRVERKAHKDWERIDAELLVRVLPLPFRSQGRLACRIA